MALVKSSSRFGKKPAAIAVPHKGAAKKSQAAKKSASAKSAGVKPSKSKKSSKSAAKFASLKAKQMTVDRLKRTVWASAQKITEAIISAASSGNLAAAKELFSLAGLYDIPAPDDENAAAAADRRAGSGGRRGGSPTGCGASNRFVLRQDWRTPFNAGAGSGLSGRPCKIAGL